MESRGKPGEDEINRSTKHLSQRPPSAPVLEVFDSNNDNHDNQWNKCTISNNSLGNSMRQNQLRTLSMPHLLPDNGSREEGKESAFQTKHCSNGLLLGPPKPPRTNVNGGFFMQRTTENTKFDKTEIRAALQNWQLGLMSEDKQMAAYRAMSNVRSVGDGKGKCNVSVQ